jgi:hypothetical protein
MYCFPFLSRGQIKTLLPQDRALLPTKSYCHKRFCFSLVQSSGVVCRAPRFTNALSQPTSARMLNYYLGDVLVRVLLLFVKGIRISSSPSIMGGSVTAINILPKIKGLANAIRFFRRSSSCSLVSVLMIPLVGLFPNVGSTSFHVLSVLH